MMITAQERWPKCHQGNAPRKHSCNITARLTTANPLGRGDYNSTVSVFAGEEEQQFTIHKNKICAKSKFFRDACLTPGTEGELKPIKLPMILARDFQIYFDWIYTSQIQLECEDARQKQDIYVAIYTLGDMLGDYQLRNAAIERLIENLPFAAAPPSIELFRQVYQFTSVGSPLRRYLVDSTILKGSRRTLNGNMAKFPAEFAQELAVALLNQTPVVSRKDIVKILRGSFKPETGDV
jgi:hypothetical protein